MWNFLNYWCYICLIIGKGGVVPITLWCECLELLGWPSPGARRTSTHPRKKGAIFVAFSHAFAAGSKTWGWWARLASWYPGDWQPFEWQNLVGPPLFHRCISRMFGQGPFFVGFRIRWRELAFCTVDMELLCKAIGGEFIWFYHEGFSSKRIWKWCQYGWWTKYPPLEDRHPTKNPSR